LRSVLKFGGTSVGSGEGLRNVANIIASALFAQQETPVVVVSALAGITDALLSVAQHVYTQEMGAAKQELHAVRQQHIAAAHSVVIAPERRQHLLADLNKCFAGLDVDADQLRQTYMEPTRMRTLPLLEPLIEQGKVPVIPGFIGRTETGSVRTARYGSLARLEQAQPGCLRLHWFRIQRGSHESCPCHYRPGVRGFPVITQGASEHVIILIGENQDCERSVRSLHHALVAPVSPPVRHSAHEERRYMPQEVCQ